MKIKPNDQIAPLSKDLVYISEGLTIRQHFASMAMQGLLNSTDGLRSPIDAIARIAVDMADMLIKQLNAKDPL